MKSDTRFLIEVNKWSDGGKKFAQSSQVVHNIKDAYCILDRVSGVYFEKFGLPVDISRSNAINRDNVSDCAAIIMANHDKEVRIQVLPYAMRHPHHFTFDKRALEQSQEDKAETLQYCQREVYCINCLTRALERMEDNEVVQEAVRMVRKRTYKTLAYTFAQCQKHEVHRTCIMEAAKAAVAARKEVQHA